jgi:5-methylcytosine-specific restriction endonuclease McrA
MNSIRKNELRAKLMARQKGRCNYCRQPMTRPDPSRPHPSEATLDHIVPLSAGGSNGVRNLVLACRACNERKGSRDVFDFIATGEAAE